MSTRVVLLENPSEGPLSRLLEQLGASFERYASLGDALSRHKLHSNNKDVLILSGQYLNNARALAQARSISLEQLFGDFAAVLLCAWNAETRTLGSLAEWIGGKLEVIRFQGNAHHYAVKPVELAKPFSGLEFGPVNSESDFGLAMTGTRCPIETVVAVDEFPFFFRALLPATQVFVSCSCAVFRVDAEARRNLTAASEFSGLVPLLLFLRHCGISAWQTPLPGASMVIDDLDLQERYGFVDTPTLAQWVDKLGCAVSIGFIPWNFKRTSPSVVELFRSRWPRLSLCVHGCDHVETEFCGDVFSSRQIIALALERMNRLTENTGLSYDKVMVFPRGEFSGSAMQALHQSSFLAAVNTELIDTQLNRGVLAGELLQPAITSYSGFPLFLRRSADEPIANFALDLLLGKPCLVGTHHDYFRDGFEPLVILVHSLNALNPALRWSNLETIVSGTYSMRINAESQPEVRLFSRFTRLAIPTPAACISLSKTEPMEERAYALINGHEIAASRNGSALLFPAELNCESETAVTINASRIPAATLPAYPVRYRLKVAIRRHLSRIRDNQDAGPAWQRLLWRIVCSLSAKAKVSIKSRDKKPRFHCA